MKIHSLMIGSERPDELAEFYERVLSREADMQEETWYGWQLGRVIFTVEEHSEVRGTAQEPERVILNFETDEVQEHFERIKGLGAEVVKEPYEMAGMWIATFRDPDGNLFQLMSPWPGD